MLAREKWQVRTIAVLEDVFEERKKQVLRYGHNEDLADGTGPETRWLLPFTTASAKEISVALRAAYEDYEEETGEPTWVHLVLEEVHEAFECGDAERLRSELVQVAALCASWIEKLDAR